MNQNLQKIFNFLQQDELLSAEEKASLTKAVADADKEMEITAFKLDRTEKVKRTTSILLEETIEELEQKRKAVEAQNRDLEIESSLERIRTVAMGMRKPDDMLEVCRIISQQSESLGIKEIRNVQTAIIYESKGTYLNYEHYAKHDKLLVTEVDFKNHELQSLFANQMLRGAEELFSSALTGKEVQDWYDYQKTTNQFADSYLENAQSLNYYFYSLGPVALGISTYSPLSEEEINLFKRFRNVFDLAYRRFLDIEKAEAQSREAQIELGLERVRARAMAMQKSDELAELVDTVFTELTKLHFLLDRCIIMIYDPTTHGSTWWMANPEPGSVPVGLFIKNHKHKPYQEYIKAWQAQTLKWEYLLEGTSKKEWDTYIFSETDLSLLPEFVIDGMRSVERVFLNASFNNFGSLTVSTIDPLPEAQFEIVLRFAKVFDMTYTRFHDLKQAEAQAREAQIEAALERVRSRTMAMQKSEELADVAQVLFQQVKQLGIKTWSTGVNIWQQGETSYIDWVVSTSDGQFMTPYTVDLTTHPFFREISNAKRRGDDFFVIEAEGETLAEHYRLLFKMAKIQFEDLLKSGFQMPEHQINHYVFGQQVSLMFITLEACPEAHDIFKRLGSVFEQTYTRFLDLQKAEAQAREARIEAALERVRSRTLAMQKSDELAETSAVLFQQLIQLGIEPNRLYITIIKDDQANAEFWITDEDGSKVSSAFETNLNNNPVFKKMLEGWKGKKSTLTIDMKGEELQEYFRYLSSLNVPFKGGLAQTRRIQNLGYFNKGFIGMASLVEQPEETIQLLARFAAVFNLTFTRFNDLKIAEAHAIQAEEDLLKLQTEKQRAEEALAELQVTQKQLIQAEKMASLGELTAGIAHEIQNPLNFVNNFSEVSSELLDEMKAELDRGDTDEAKAIAADVKQNLEKILHHGKRADAIVKGMLQHSRSSNGIKEPTDINALADEYFRLAYHGLRAKDKSFNATLKTDFDSSIGNINIIPQDIGRVILNLITNAFYACAERRRLSEAETSRSVVDEKKKQLGSVYEPTVSVKTRKTINKVELLVTDNGNGIPQKVVDKIFQPFFTTKPSGQGTGLGLSMSYDIVKAHGGELKVQTTEGEGSVFTVMLPA